MDITIFIDTCVFLQHEPLGQIRWTTLAGAQRCSLRVPIAVVRELEDQKDHPKSERKRRRAREAFQVLKKVDPGVPSPLVGYVTLSVEFQDALEATFQREGLNSAVPDDHVVARCCEFADQEGLAREDVAVATSDAGLVFKAKGHGFRVVDLAGVQQLPDERTADQIAKERAEKALNQFLDRQPALAVDFGNGEHHKVFRAAAFIAKTQDELLQEAEAEFLTRKSAIELVRRTRGILHAFDSRAAEAEARANALGDVRKRYAELDQKSRTLEIVFRLVNGGRGPATDVEVKLLGHTDGVFLEPPSYPVAFPGAISGRPSDGIPHWTLQMEQGMQRLRGAFHSKSVLANTTARSRHILIVFPREGPRRATFEWTAHCAEFSEATKGQLTIAEEEVDREGQQRRRSPHSQRRR